MDDQTTPEVFAAVESYIRDKTKWELFVLPSSNGHMMSIMKGIPAGFLEKAERGEPLELPENLQGDIDLLDPASEEFVENVNDLWAMLGTKYPMFMMGTAQCEGEVVLATSCSVHFEQSLVLDYSDPKFFTQLDQVINHVLTHDDLSQFVLQA